MKKEYIHIEDLLERFFEGLTTNEEERELYTFFQSGNVPEHLQQYCPVFDYFESGIQQELCKPVERKTSFQLITALKWVTGVAAIICLYIALGNYWTNKATDDFYPFEGSYIVRNGVKITDPEIIEPELIRTLQEVEEKQQAINKILESANKSYAIPTAEERIEALLESYENEHVKEEVRKILLNN